MRKDERVKERMREDGGPVGRRVMDRKEQRKERCGCMKRGRER